MTVNLILNFGDQWYSKNSPPLHNNFWHDIFKDWQALNKLHVQQSQNDCQLLRNRNWYISHISKN